MVPTRQDEHSWVSKMERRRPNRSLEAIAKQKKGSKIDRPGAEEGGRVLKMQRAMSQVPSGTVGSKTTPDPYVDDLRLSGPQRDIALHFHSIPTHPPPPLLVIPIKIIEAFVFTLETQTVLI